MIVSNAVMPTGEQLQAVLARDDGKPVVMLNLLKFRETADYGPDGEKGVPGREAYARYGAEMAPYVLSKGGRLIFTGSPRALAIGEVGEMWDMVALMEYPSAKAFVEIATSPDIAPFARHRKAGLAGQLLIMCGPQ